MMKQKRLCFVAAVSVVALVLCGCPQEAGGNSVVESPKYRAAAMSVPRAGVLLPDSIPIRLKNMEPTDLKVEVIPEAAPFTATIQSKTMTSAVLVFVPNGKPTTKEPVQVKVSNTIDGSVVANFTVTPDQLGWRTYNAGDKSYSFKLVKMFHCDGERGTVGASSANDGTLGLVSSGQKGDVTESGSVITVRDTATDGTQIACCHDGDRFTQGSYDYFEIRFRSESDQSTNLTLNGAAGLTFSYAAGQVRAQGGGSDNPSKETTYQDADSDWVTLGFWNSSDDTGCLFVEDFSATEDTIDSQSSLSHYAGFTTVTVATGATTEIDYIAFFKKVADSNI